MARGRRQDLPRNDQRGDAGQVHVQHPDREVPELLAAAIPISLGETIRGVLDDDAHHVLHAGGPACLSHERRVDERRPVRRRTRLSLLGGELKDWQAASEVGVIAATDWDAATV